MNFETHYCDDKICLHGLSTRDKVIKLALLSGWNLEPAPVTGEEVRLGKGAWLGSRIPEPLSNAAHSVSVYFDARGAISQAFYVKFTDGSDGFCTIAKPRQPNKYQRVADVLTSDDPYTTAQKLRGYWSLRYPRKAPS